MTIFFSDEASTVSGTRATQESDGRVGHHNGGGAGQHVDRGGSQHVSRGAGHRGGRGRARATGRMRQPVVQILWQEVDHNLDVATPLIPFTEPVGPSVTLPEGSTPFDYFTQIVDRTVVQILVKETNK